MKSVLYVTCADTLLLQNLWWEKIPFFINVDFESCRPCCQRAWQGLWVIRSCAMEDDHPVRKEGIGGAELVVIFSHGWCKEKKSIYKSLNVGYREEEHYFKFELFLGDLFGIVYSCPGDKFGEQYWFLWVWKTGS